MSDMAYTVRWIDADGDTQIAAFDTSREAWNFMRLCDLHGVKAGYPSLGREAVTR